MMDEGRNGEEEGRWEKDPQLQYRVYGRKRGHLDRAGREALALAVEHYRPPVGEGARDFWHPVAGEWVLEVGFGSGITLSALAERYPEQRFLGVDVFLEGASDLVQKIRDRGLGNVWLRMESVQSVLFREVPDEVFSRVLIHFPDPWPKTKHHKRRLIQAPFLDLLARKMRPGGRLELATDWAPYAKWMLERISSHPGFLPAAKPGPWAEAPEDWVVTRFQYKGERAGRTVHHLAFVKREVSSIPEFPASEPEKDILQIGGTTQTGEA